MVRVRKRYLIGLYGAFLTEAFITPKMIPLRSSATFSKRWSSPEPLIPEYHTEEEAFIVKAADVLCAYLKTLEELNAGNREFTLAKKRLDKMLKDYHSEEVDYFLKRYIPSFSLSLDEITQEEIIE